MGDEEIFAFFADFVNDVGNPLRRICREDSIGSDEFAANLCEGGSAIVEAGEGRRTV